MNIALFGGECLYCQLPRIREGLLFLGETLDKQNPDLIYANDPQYFEEAIKLKKEKGGFLILNILDIPWHIKEFNEVIDKWIKLLKEADAITTISFTVKIDLEKIVGRRVHVIYNPAKDVDYNEKIKKDNLFLYVGRANDPNKRIILVYEALSYIQNGTTSIKICGSENPNFGNYLGLVLDDDLNYLYNASKYTFLTSKNEGIGLSMIESMMCGSIPITCKDNLTAREFSPPEFIVEPNPKSIVEKILELNSNYDYYQNIALKYGEKYKKQFNKINIAQNILEVYKSYKKIDKE
jgi:glycosyltransferase involved in cell wall biosynthesis